MGWFSGWRKRPAQTRTDQSKSGGRPIVLPQDPSDADIRAAVAKWIELMARGDYAAAVAAVFRNPRALFLVGIQGRDADFRADGTLSI